MRRADVGDLDLTGLNSFGKRRGFDRIPVEKTFNGFARFRITGAAVIRLELEAIEARWIVAGGDHHTADSVQMFDGKGNGRRRRRLGRKDDLKAVPGENF